MRELNSLQINLISCRWSISRVVAVGIVVVVVVAVGRVVVVVAVGRVVVAAHHCWCYVLLLVVVGCLLVLWNNLFGSFLNYFHGLN